MKAFVPLALMALGLFVASAAALDTLDYQRKLTDGAAEDNARMDAIIARFMAARRDAVTYAPTERQLKFRMAVFLVNSIRNTRYEITSPVVANVANLQPSAYLSNVLAAYREADTKASSELFRLTTLISELKVPAALDAAYDLIDLLENRQAQIVRDLESTMARTL